MATIIQCKFCKMPFQSLGGKVCNNCLDQIDLDFTTIRDYTYDNPGTFDIDRICEETGVAKKIVIYLIEEKRLTFSSPGSSGVFSCSICHKSIEQGNMCDDCKNSLSKTLGSVISTPAAKTKKPTEFKRSGAKMHVKKED